MKGGKEWFKRRVKQDKTQNLRLGTRQKSLKPHDKKKRDFHNWSTWTEKAWLPLVMSQDFGTINWVLPEDLMQQSGSKGGVNSQIQVSYHSKMKKEKQAVKCEKNQF